MILSPENFLLIGSIILFVAILAAKTSSRFGAPTLLFFLLVGMLFGADGLGIEFNSPKIAQFIGTIALSIILFSGGMETKYSDIKPVAAQGIVLATLGVFLTALLTGLFIYSVAGFFNISISLPESLLLASVMSSTDSASVFSILRSKRQGLKQNVKPMLELESGSNDPMAYILTIILVQFIASGGDISVWQAVLMFVIQMSIGAIAGYLLGRLAVKILNSMDLENKSLYSVLLLSIVFFIFSATDLMRGNGYLAVYIAGLIVGNNRIVFQKSLITFFDGFTWLFQIVMFITLGLLVNPSELLGVWHIGLLVGVFMILIGRPVSVFLCLAPFRKMTLKAKTYVSWVGLRGAVPIIFATYPWVANLDNADLIFNTVFFITIVSLLIQGTTVSSMAKRLGLATEMEADGFGIDLPDEIQASLIEREIGASALANGNTIKQMSLPANTLVMMIRRSGEYIVPKGDTELFEGDRLLCISTDEEHMPRDYEVTKAYQRKMIAKEKIAQAKEERRRKKYHSEDGSPDVELEIMEEDVTDSMVGLEAEQAEEHKSEE